MSDAKRKVLRGTGQAPDSRDRVGGGMQHSTAKPSPPESEDAPWEPKIDCENDFHYVKFERGTVLCGCKCLMAWYND